MTRLIYSSETSGCGATIELDSQETCLVSVAQSWVLVKSCRGGKYRRIMLGLFGSVLYNEKDAFKIAMTAQALHSRFPEKRIPITFRNPILGAFANAIWQCSTAAEVTVTLNEAIARTEKQASDAKIVSDYTTFITKSAGRPDCFYDVNMLPHPKEAIIGAIEREIVRSPLEEHVNWLRTGAAFLWNFLEGVGPDPLPLLGVDDAQLGRTSLDDPARLRELANTISNNPNSERAQRFRAIAERESKQIEERIAAAVRARPKA